MVGRILRRGWRRRRARLAHPARRLEQAGRAHHHQGRPVHEVRRVPDGRVAANVHHVDVVAHGGALVGPERQRGHGGVKAVVWAADNGEVEAAFGELDARVGRDHVKLPSPGRDGTGHKVRADGHAARGREWNVASGAGGALVARRRGLEPLEKVWRARGAVKHACYLRGGRVAAVLAATPSAHGGGGLAGHRARHVLLLLLLLRKLLVAKEAASPTTAAAARQAVEIGGELCNVQAARGRGALRLRRRRRLAARDGRQQADQACGLLALLALLLIGHQLVVGAQELGELLQVQVAPAAAAQLLLLPGGRRWRGCLGRLGGHCLQSRHRTCHAVSTHASQHIGRRLEESRVGRRRRRGRRRAGPCVQELVQLGEHGVVAAATAQQLGQGRGVDGRGDGEVGASGRAGIQLRLPLLAPPRVVRVEAVLAAALGAIKAVQLVQAGALLAEAHHLALGQYLRRLEVLFADLVTDTVVRLVLRLQLAQVCAAALHAAFQRQLALHTLALLLYRRRHAFLWRHCACCPSRVPGGLLVAFQTPTGSLAV
mmetsp:Transcript_35708/g.92732  ORF Transcript_35708/g.92732 Transcript_35708/m.92732 type:complete len:543 (-) Transcript_35708:101-1729(-)